MKIKSIVTKLLRNEELNALERAELECFDPDALQAKIDELERAQLSREEALQRDLAGAQSERDALRAERDALIRKGRIAELAASSGCTEPEYLDFLAARRKVELDDADAVREFIAEIERDNPHCFRSRLRAGSGDRFRAAEERETAGSGVPRPSDRIGAIVSALGGAPEADTAE